jgi:YVTN family beta-propeller protein
VIDAETMRVVKKIPVGKIPWGVAIGSTGSSGS